MSPSDSTKLCQEPLAPASRDAPPSISLVQRLGDFYFYSAVSLLEITGTLTFAINQRCLISGRTTLPWLGTSHSAWAGLGARSAVVHFAKYPVSGLSFHLGMVLFSPILWHGGSNGNPMTFPLPCHQALTPRGRREGCFAGSSPCSYITQKMLPTNSEIHFGASRP